MTTRRQPMACVGGVLRLLGPTGCDPAFCVVWFRFRLLRRYLSLWPTEVARGYRLLEMVSEGCPGHGPVHLLSVSAAEVGFRWDPLSLSWSRPGLHLLGNLASPVQHFRAAILDAWRNKVAADLCGRKGFRGGPLLDVHGSLQYVVIVGTLWLVALLLLLLFFPAWFNLIGGLLPILRFGLFLIAAGGNFGLRSLFSALPFGLLLGCLLLIRVGVPSRLRFRGFARFQNKFAKVSTSVNDYSF